MQTPKDLLVSTLRKLVDEQIEAVRDGLERPIDSTTMHNYNAGWLYGLRQLKELLAEAETIISKR